MRNLALVVIGLVVGWPTGGMAQKPAGIGLVPARLVLNVPATRLDVWRGDSLLRSFRVAVGSRAFPTPIGEFQVTELTWNPWWVPPPSDWAKNEKTQPPGPHNNMGRVKIRFGPTLYLHGTPYTSSIGQAASHGCVRMRNRDAIELGQLVLTLAGPELEAELLDALIRDTTATQRVQLDCSVPLSVRYDVAEVRDSALEVHPDVYRRAVNVRTAALAALNAHGIAESEIDIERLDRFLRERAGPHARIALRELLKASDRGR
jgi:murein L,D-transpeptidase YcbB/YkuD